MTRTAARAKKRGLGICPERSRRKRATSAPRTRGTPISALIAGTNAPGVLNRPVIAARADAAAIHIALKTLPMLTIVKLSPGSSGAHAFQTSQSTIGRAASRKRVQRGRCGRIHISIAIPRAKKRPHSKEKTEQMRKALASWSPSRSSRSSASRAARPKPIDSRLLIEKASSTIP